MCRYWLRHAATLATCKSTHTLRHFKACKLYSETKDILFVKEFLGHRSTTSTMKYLRIVPHFEADEDFIVKATNKPEEATALLEKGFQYQCDVSGVSLFRKRK